MADKGEGGVKNLKKWVMSFIDGPCVTVINTMNHHEHEFPMDDQPRAKSILIKIDMRHYIG